VTFSETIILKTNDILGKKEKILSTFFLSNQMNNLRFVNFIQWVMKKDHLAYILPFPFSIKSIL